MKATRLGCLCAGLIGIALQPDLAGAQIPPYQSVAQWGTYGTGAGQFKNPYGIATSRSGRVYVADTFGHRIQKFTNEGDYLREWGTRGNGNGQFDTPYAVAVDTSGAVYVADTYNCRIQKFTSEGIYITQFGNGQFYNPQGVAVGPDGAVYVADTYNQRIQKFTSDGTYLAQWSLPNLYPLSVAVNGTAVYVTGCNSDYPGGALVRRFTHGGGPNGGWGTEGNGNGQFSYPSGVALDPRGDVYVADTGNNRIQKFTSDGAYVV